MFTDRDSRHESSNKASRARPVPKEQLKSSVAKLVFSSELERQLNESRCGHCEVYIKTNAAVPFGKTWCAVTVSNITDLAHRFCKHDFKVLFIKEKQPDNRYPSLSGTAMLFLATAASLMLAVFLSQLSPMN